ncbi:MAG: hypothetical protein Q9160_007804 [Pyrenula sp. 1 TL-2023]
MATPGERPRYARVLIDADEYLFNSSLLRMGFRGGEAAAAILEDYVVCLMEEVGVRSPKQRTVSARLFWNKSQTARRLPTKGFVQNLETLRDFYDGFLSSHRNWTIADCGTMKRAANKSLLECLKEYTISFDANEIYLLGCSHYSGYISGPELKDKRIRHKIFIIKGHKVDYPMKWMQLPFVGFPAIFKPFEDEVESDINLEINPERHFMPRAALIGSSQIQLSSQQKRLRDTSPHEASQPPKKVMSTTGVDSHVRQANLEVGDGVLLEAQDKTEHEQPEARQLETQQPANNPAPIA